MEQLQSIETARSRTPRVSPRRHRRNTPTMECPLDRNKENLYSLSKKRVSSRILKIQFPINRPSRPKALPPQQTPNFKPLLQSIQNGIELQKCVQSEELDSSIFKAELQTQRWKSWRLRKCNNVASLSQNLQGHVRKRTLGERQVGKLRLLPSEDPLASTKRAIDRLFREKIEGWERSSSHSDQQDSGPRRI